MKERRVFTKPTSVIMKPEEAKEIIITLTDGYKKKKIENRLYNEEDYIPENIIIMYYYFINRNNYQFIVKNYKKKYIDNESVVEPGVTKCERKGLGLVYDYISNYDFSNKEPNIFVESLIMHSKLYSKCPHPEFGGTIRTSPVKLVGSSYEVPSASEAGRIFQSYVTKKMDINSDYILDYIDEAIKTTIDLIKIQPFEDGNKRTFRALLNLLLGRIGIPPIYIREDETEIYRKELLKAIESDNYTRMTRFYYYKICDSIVELDFNRIKDKNEESKHFIMKHRLYFI